MEGTRIVKKVRTSSPEARQILAESLIPPMDRSLETLFTLRSKTRDFIEPAVKHVIKKYKVKIEACEIGGVSCLRVVPFEQLVEWKILYGFGGGFVTGSPFEDLTIAAPLCAITGACLIIPHYRLAPEYPWPAAIDDGFAVYRVMSQKPFALVGESAGGNLVLSLMLRAKQLGIPLPGSVALISPWCDLTNSGDSLSDNDGLDPVLTAQHLDFAVKHYAGDNTLTDPSISPINGKFNKTFPPILITTGTRDLLFSQAMGLTEVLREQDVVVDLRVWEDLWHVFEWDEKLPEAQESVSQIAKFLAEHTA